MRIHALIPSVLVSGLALLLVAGCTRPEGESTKVTLTLPMLNKQSLQSKSGPLSKVTTLSNESFYLALNVTGAGNQIVCTYESRDQVSSGPCVFSFPNVTIEIQQGSGILFQVMLAEDGEESMDLLYGEKTDEVKGSASTVKLSVASILTSGSSGHVEGRYIGGTAAAPTFKTGKMNIKFAPPTGSKAMTVLQSEMFAGWFRGGRALEGVNFIYEVEGEQLFPNLTSGLGFAAFDQIVSTIVANATNEVLKVLEDGETNFFYFGGFFGPGVSTSTYSALASGCSVNLYTTCLEVSGTNGVTPFRGPFKPYAGSSSNYVYVNGSNWEFQTLPGVNDSVIDGVKVYKLSNLSNPQIDLKPYALDDGRWNCERIKKDGQLLTTVDQANAKVFQEPAGLSSANAVFLCPFKGDRLFTTAVGYPDYVNQFSGRGYQGDYLHLNYEMVNNSGESRVLIKNHCYKASVGLYEGHGNQKVTPANLIVNFDTSGAPGLSYHTDASCSSPLISDADADSHLDVVISGGTSSTDVYVMSSIEGTAEQRYSSATIPGVTFQLVTHLGRLELVGPTKANNGECFAVELLQKNGIGEPVPLLQTTLINISGSGLEFYDNSDNYCAGSQIPHLEIVEPNSTNYRFFVKKTSSGNKTLAITDTSAGMGNFLTFPLFINDRTGSPIAQNLKLEIFGPSPMLFSGCYPASASLVNILGEKVPALVQAFYPISLNHGHFYYDGSCMGTPSEVVYLMPGQSQQNLFFRPDPTLIANGSMPTPVANLFTGVPYVGSTIVTSPMIENPATSALYLKFASVPNFKSRVIGSHEFGVSRNVVLAAPPGASVSCTEAAPPLYNTFTPCADFDPATKTLNWTLAKAVSNQWYFFRASSNNKSVELTFRPGQYYGGQTMMVQDQFMVRNCDIIITAAQSPINGTDLNTALANGTVCLNNGVIVEPGMVQIGLHSNGVVTRSLIGWAGNASGTERNLVRAQVDAGATIFARVDAALPVENPAILANLIVESAPNAPAVQLSTSSSLGQAFARWTNLKIFSGTGSANSAVQIDTNTRYVSLYAEDLTLDLANAWTGVKIMDNGSETFPSSTEFNRIKIINSAVDGTIVKGFTVLSNTPTSPTNLNVEDVQMVVPGTPLEIDANSGGAYVHFERAELDGGGSGSPRPVIQITGTSVNFSLINSKVTTAVLNGPIINLLTDIQSLNLRNNIFNRTSNGNFIDLNLGSVTDFSLVANSFRTSNVASSYVLSSTDDVSFGDSMAVSSPAAGFHYYNRLCHTGAQGPLAISAGTMTNGLLPASVAQAPLATGACP